MPVTTTATSTTSENEWPVQLYRYTESDDWQHQQVGGGRIAASPRKDCIVIPALRQKFSLLSSEGGDKSCVIRRDHCILLVSRRRTRAMVLQFSSVQDCLDFSDRFVELNPPPAMLSPPTNTTTGTNDDVIAPEAAIQIAAQPAQQEEVVSYLARLLHDDSFLGLVHKLETYLGNTTDGAHILEGLATRNLRDSTTKVDVAGSRA
jgi:hypothetical protein